jgi:hypothetical protein
MCLHPPWFGRRFGHCAVAKSPQLNVILRETGVLCIPSAGGEYSSTPLPSAGGEYSSTPLPSAGGAYQSTAGRKSPRAAEQLSISQWESSAHRGERGAALCTFILVCVTAANGSRAARPRLSALPEPNANPSDRNRSAGEPVSSTYRLASRAAAIKRLGLAQEHAERFKFRVTKPGR